MTDFRWRKIGPVFNACGQAPWMQSHASVPLAEPLGGHLWRVYFSTRDARNRSHTGTAVLDLERPDRLLDLSMTPVLAPGELGAFDDSGAMATWLCRQGSTSYLYYIGWNLGVTVPFRNAIGLATRQSNEPFIRVGPGPVVDRSLTEPHFTASCCVLPGTDEPWRMWYLSCTGWTVEPQPKHRYHIKYAESDDGLQWRRQGVVAIDFADDDEYAISRPSVVRAGSSWHMWYSHRGSSYRIGYAHSEDGVSWRRQDHAAGIDVSTSGWDSHMIEYPFVFQHEGEMFMLYNGNGYGSTGFGIATARGFANA